jgi:hypothetical protein
MQNQSREALRDQAVEAARAQAADAAAVAQDYASAVRAAVREGIPIPPPPPGLRVITDGGKMTIIGGRSINVITMPQDAVGPEGTTVTTEPPPFPFQPPEIPQEAVVMTLAFFAMVAIIVVGWPIARALGRRIDRSRQPMAPALPDDTANAIRRIEQSVDAMALEVERISENQRYVTKLLAERPHAAAELPDARR